MFGKNLGKDTRETEISTGKEVAWVWRSLVLSSYKKKKMN
jgi:hypothetical protein